MTGTDGKFYLQGTDAKKESFNIPQQRQFEWNIIYTCNFRCSYCIFDGKWEAYGPRTVFKTVEEWKKLWLRIFFSYGRCALLITGGEPFLYPDFIPMLKEISKLHFPINISSNGSGDLKTLVASVEPRKVSVTLSFHPQFNRLEDVIASKQFLRSHGFESEFINFVCYPPFFKDLDRWVQQAVDAGEKLKVIPYCGPYEGKQYPDGYTDEQKAKLGLSTVWEGNVKRLGKVCKAGMQSALIFPDGKVGRCGQIGERFLVGNIFDENFRLLERPLGCESKYCPCLEADISEEQHG